MYINITILIAIGWYRYSCSENSSAPKLGFQTKRCSRQISITTAFSGKTQKGPCDSRSATQEGRVCEGPQKLGEIQRDVKMLKQTLYDYNINIYRLFLEFIRSREN